jgi:hypothetical protein
MVSEDSGNVKHGSLVEAVALHKGQAAARVPSIIHSSA